MAGPSTKYQEVRSLTGTAQEMIDHARELMARADDTAVSEAERAQLRAEADRWLDKAISIAKSANRLVKK